MVELKSWLFFTLVGCLVTALITTGVFFYQKNEAQTELAHEKAAKDAAVYNLDAMKKNRANNVKAEADKFLRALLESDTQKSKPSDERIKPYATEKAREDVYIPGSDQVAQADSPIHIVTKIKKLKMYYTDTAPDKASIFASVTREVKVDRNDPTPSDSAVELEMILKDDKWIVNGVKLIGP